MHFIRLIIVNVDFIGVITRTTVALEVFFNMKIKILQVEKALYELYRQNFLCYSLNNFCIYYPI